MVLGGSCYHGTKIANAIEYDVYVIMDGTDLVAFTTPDSKCHAALKPKRGQGSKFTELMEDGYVHVLGERWANKFHQILATLRSQHRELEVPNVTFIKLGPVVQMDVYKDNLWFKVDLIPTFQLSSNVRYGAKPYRSEASLPLYAHLWYRCFPEEELDVFAKMDQDGGCRKDVFKVLKLILREHLVEETMPFVTSFHFKTLLLLRLAHNPDESWNADQLSKRVLDLLVAMERAIERGWLDHYFIWGVNLFRGIGRDDLDYWYSKLRRLTASDKYLLNVISK